ncbi:MAG: hypothetical protein JWQ02_2538 [Capsulimonas sp.]|jgi:hypothetical protein|nr:hypothetical protein [Capsulimonas sp.]
MLHMAPVQFTHIERTAYHVRALSPPPNSLQTKYGPAKDGLVMALRYAPISPWKDVQRHKFEVSIRNVSHHSIAYFWHAYWVRPSLTDKKGREMQNFKDFGPQIKWKMLGAENMVVLKPGEEKIAGIWLVSVGGSISRKEFKPGHYQLQGVLVNPLTHREIAAKMAKYKQSSFIFWRGDQLKTPKAVLSLIGNL